MNGLRLLHHSPEASDPKGCYCLRGRYLLAVTSRYDASIEPDQLRSVLWVLDLTVNEKVLEVLRGWAIGPIER